MARRVGSLGRRRDRSAHRVRAVDATRHPGPAAVGARRHSGEIPKKATTRQQTSAIGGARRDQNALQTCCTARSGAAALRTPDAAPAA